MLPRRDRIADDDISQGREFFVAKKYALAAKCFQNRVENGEEECEELSVARVFWGVSLFYLQRTKEALAVFSKISDEKKCSLVCLYKGLCLAAENETEAALVELSGFTDFKKPLVMRAINLQRGLFEEGFSVSADELQQDILDAVDKSGDVLEWK